MSDSNAADDLRFMQLALALGRRGLGRTAPNPSVGAVIVRDGIIVGRGWTQDGGRPHAETEALRRAGEAAHGATMYVTLEPCSHHGKTPPCADAIIAAGIARVVSTIDDPNPEVAGQGHARIRAQGIRVDVGLCDAEARRAHAGHIRRVFDGRPHVLLKLAVSADEKAGLAGRRPVAITGEAARDRVHMMRAMNDGVLIGIGTALADDPLLTCRLPGMRSPVRIVLDARLRLPVTSRLVAGASEVPVWVMTAPDVSVEAEQTLTQKGVRVLRVPKGPKGLKGLDLPAAMRTLARERLTRLMVEGGPIVAASFLAADLVDEAALLRAPNLIGADGIDALEGMPLSALTQSPGLKPIGAERLGSDSIEFFGRT